LCSWFSSIPVA